MISSFLAGHDPPTPVAFQQEMGSIAEVQPGQHLLIKKRKPQHLLVKSCNPYKNEFTVFKEEERRIAETTMKFPPYETLILEISYDKELCPIESADATVQKAEDAMRKAEFTSQSHFATEMKTGSPLTVDRVLSLKQ